MILVSSFVHVSFLGCCEFELLFFSRWSRQVSGWVTVSCTQTTSIDSITSWAERSLPYPISTGMHFKTLMLFLRHICLSLHLCCYLGSGNNVWGITYKFEKEITSKSRHDHSLYGSFDTANQRISGRAGIFQRFYYRFK